MNQIQLVLIILIIAFVLVCGIAIYLYKKTSNEGDSGKVLVSKDFVEYSLLVHHSLSRASSKQEKNAMLPEALIGLDREVRKMEAEQAEKKLELQLNEST